MVTHGDDRVRDVGDRRKHNFPDDHVRSSPDRRPSGLGKRGGPDIGDKRNHAGGPWDHGVCSRWFRGSRQFRTVRAAVVIVAEFGAKDRLIIKVGLKKIS